MKKLRITIGKKSYDVTVEVLEDDGSPTAASTSHVAAPIRPAPLGSKPAPSPAPAAPAPPETPPGENMVISPLAGVIVSILVKEGDEVEKDQDLVILEAMKMENKITAPSSAVIKSVNVQEGESVLEGHVLMALE